MTDDRELSLILEDWLAGGPNEMPDRVIDGVAIGIARQRQRPGWRLRLVKRRVDMNLQFAAVIAIVVAVGVIGYSLGGGFSTAPDLPSPSTTLRPTAEPTPTHRATPSPRPRVPLMKRFTSSVNRYSISYPDGWTVTPATRAFRSGSSLTIADPSVDAIASPDGRTALYVMSMAVPDGLTENSWHTTQGQLKPDTEIVCPPNEPARYGLTVSVGGVAGTAIPGCRGIGYGPLIDHRGYAFLLYPSPTGSGSDEEWSDEDLFVEMLDSVAVNP